MHIWQEKGTDNKGLIPDNWLDVVVQMAVSPMVSKWIQKNRCERAGVRQEGKKKSNQIIQMTFKTPRSQIPQQT